MQADRNKNFWARRVPTVLAGAVAVGVVLMSAQLAASQTSAGPLVRQFGTSAHDVATTLVVDAAGNVYVGGWTSGIFTGQTYAGGANDAYVRKYDATGRELWTREFGTTGTDMTLKVAVDQSANVYVAGQFGGSLPGHVSSGAINAFVRKYDATGSELWTRQFGTAGSATANSLFVDGSGAVYVAGWVNGALPGQTQTSQSDAYVRKYDSSGTEFWTRQFGGAGQDPTLVTNGVTGDGSGGVYVWGQSTLPNDRHGEFVSRFTAGGVQVSSRELSMDPLDNAVAAVVDVAGEVYVAGVMSHDQASGFLRKYAADGTRLWTVHTAGTGPDEPTALAVSLSGNVYVVGESVGTAGNGALGGQHHVRAAEYDANGTPVLQGSVTSPGLDVGSGIALDSGGNLYVCGWTSGRLPGQTSLGLTDAFFARSP
jgi:Beta-propeller repeat